MKKARRKGTFNIGTFLFGAVLLYLIIALILYFTRSHISPYEITRGSIVEDSLYTGVIVRSEQEVDAPRGGYLICCMEDGSKAGSGQPVCALSGKVVADRMNSDAEAGRKKKKKIPAAQESVILSGIQDYVTSYSADHYSDLYGLHRRINAAYGITTADYLRDQIDELAKSGADIGFIESPTDGIIVYTVDSLDGLREEDVESSTFDRQGYKERIIRQGTELKKGEHVFRIVTGEKWSVFFPLSEENARKLGELKQIETRIGNMQSTIWGDFEVVESSGDKFGKLTYSSGMLPFAAQRFVTVELILQNDTGLKIPRSAVAERKMYEVPGDYVLTDPNTGSSGVQTVGEDGSRTFTELEVFCRSERKGQEYCYIKPESVAKGTVIGKDNSKETFRIGRMAAMKGVYNINKGYASFQHIDVTASNSTYFIIEENTLYGPSIYDHIALNASGLEENRVVH